MSGINGCQLGIARRLCALAATACAIFSLSVSQASADTIEIYFSGIDIAYDGTDIVDSDPDGASSDPIISASYVINGALIGTADTDVTADLLIDDISLLLNSTVMSTGPNSFFRLEFPDTNDAGTDRDFMLFQLDDVMVTTIDGGPVDFVFNASLVESNGFSASDNTPFGAYFDQDFPIVLSFSSQTLANLGVGPNNQVLAFNASGTGEVRGEFIPNPNQIIPEPASVGMVVLAGLMGGVYAMRKRLG